MSRLSIYLFLLPCLFAYQAFDASSYRWSPDEADIAPDQKDSCRVVTEYQYTHKIMEGMVCNDKREGLWKEWYADGRLKDSAIYMHGVRVYAADPLSHARGTVVFRNNPKQFYLDSTYECSVRVNVYHGIHDIRGEYDGMPDTAYPPLFYFGADMGARDSFNYYYTPKSAGRFKLKLSFTGDAASAAGTASFYEREMVVVRK